MTEDEIFIAELDERIRSRRLAVKLIIVGQILVLLAIATMVAAIFYYQRRPDFIIMLLPFIALVVLMVTDSVERSMITTLEEFRDEALDTRTHERKRRKRK